MLAVGAVIAVAGILYVRDLTATVTHSGGSPIGTITFKRNNAQQRFGSDVIWQQAAQNMPVYNLEYLRTVANSAAIVHLEDGTQIALDANTLVQLDWTNRNKQINLLAGNITAQRSSTGAANQVLIKSQGASVAVASADVSLSKNDAGLNVAVASGSVGLATGGSTQTVESRQIANLAAGAASATVVVQHLFPASPASDSIAIVHNGSANVTFAWSADAPAPGYSVELANDPDFTKLVQAIDAASTSASATLAAGTYYWRVKATLAGFGATTSPSSKLTILNDPPLTLISPDDGTVYSYRVDKPLIRYVWESSDIASGYRLEIAAEPTFQNPVYSSALGATAIGLDTLAEGSYYWRVTPTYSFGAESGSGRSNVRSFRITHLATLSAPLLLAPADGTIVSTTSITANGLLFNWQPNPQIATYTLLLASDPSLRKVVGRYDTALNYVLLRAAPEPGTYYWQLFAKAADGTAAPPTQPRAITIHQGNAVIELDTPADGFGYDPALIARTRFVWRSDISGNFSVQLSRTASFASTLKTVSTQVPSVAFGALDPGSYFWRVRLVNGDGEVVLASPIGSFTVLPPLGSATLERPGPGASFDLINATAVPFGWTRVPVATGYRVTIARADAPSTAAPLFTAAAPTNRLDVRDMTLFAPGSYRWSVTAVSAQTSGRSAQEGPAVSGAFTIGRVETIPAPVLVVPVAGSAIDGVSALHDGVQFTWRGPGANAPSEMSLASDPEFAHIVARFAVATDGNGAARASVPQLLPGSYYWRVTARNADGFRAPDSEVSRFTVSALAPLPTPDSMTPADGSDVDMWGKEALALSWAPVPFASYYGVRLLGGSNELYRWDRVTDPHLSFTTLASLNVGEFEWEVTAFETDRGGKVVRSSAPATARFTISLNRMSAPHITSPGVFYVH